VEITPSSRPFLPFLEFSVDHKIRVLVRLDVDTTSAHLEVAGCLTPLSCQALFPILDRVRGLTPDLCITVDLNGASHIEDAAMALLQATTGAVLYTAARPGGSASLVPGKVRILAPSEWPSCPLYEQAPHPQDPDAPPDPLADVLAQPGDLATAEIPGAAAYGAPADPTATPTDQGVAA
jgi:hypothetical protein